MEKVNLFNKFKKIVEKKSKLFNSNINFFLRLNQLNFSRVELMIIDSALKKMSFDNLHNTLLLKEDKFLESIKLLHKKVSRITS